MRLLILTPRFPHPLDKGDKVRAYHQVVELARRHEVVLCALSDRPVADRSRRELERVCRRVEVFQFGRWRGWLRVSGALAGRRPLQVAYFFDRRLATAVRSVIAEEAPDHILCQLVRAAPYLETIDIPATLDLMDAFSWGVEQRLTHRPRVWSPLLRLEAARLKRFEREMVQRFDRCTIISEADRDRIDHPERDKIVVVRNGVDHTAFHPRPRDPDIDLLFVGNMGYPPNIDAAQTLVCDILPRIRQAIPGCRTVIAGASPAAAVRRLAGDGVEVTGWIDDIVDCYARSRVFVNPMRFGTGMQNKLLQAMAMAVPCVTTSMAARALGPAPDGVRIGDDAELIAAACLELLGDPSAAHELGLRGRKFVCDRFGWDQSARDLERVLMPAGDISGAGVCEGVNGVPTDGDVAVPVRSGLADLR
jgi:sugar transferase (PEP-CTERM/EpsH1 system associated)